MGGREKLVGKAEIDHVARHGDVIGPLRAQVGDHAR